VGLGTPKAHLHDEIATDKRNPTVNANGLLYGSPEISTDNMPILDPVHNTASSVKVRVRDPKTQGTPPPLKPSAYCGDEAIWDSLTNIHNPMFDEKGRVWLTSVIRPPEKRCVHGAGSAPPDPKKDMRISGSFYGVTVSPADGSIWGTVLGFPGAIVRLNPGSNPPETTLADRYELL
jgi:hypothetical protein